MENQFDPYENFKCKLLEELEKERARLVVEDSLKSTRLEPLFAISTDEEKLYLKILGKLEKTTEIETRNFLSNLLNYYGCNFKVEQMLGSGKPRFDLTIEIDGKESFIELKTQIRDGGSAVIKQMLLYQKSSIPGYLVLLVKDGVESRDFVERLRTDMEEAGVTAVTCCLFEEFLEKLFGTDERKRFKDAMRGFKNEVNKMLGYQLTQLCSPQNWQELKDVLHETILDFDYDKVKLDLKDPDSDGPTLTLSDRSYNKMKEIFLHTQKRYELLLGDADFAISYLSSEWVYKDFIFVESPLDVTYVVNGYLKSIEQLLWDIIYLVGQGRNIGYNDKYSVSEESAIKVTLGNIKYFLEDERNVDLFRKGFGSDKGNVITCVTAQLKDWSDKERNGYFHKDNLQSEVVINEIREKTYFLYLLILGSLKMSTEVISDLRD